MVTVTTGRWPEDLFDFAFIPGMNDQLASLAELAEAEEWDYQHTHSEYPKPVLYNYIKFTYRRLAEEGKIVLSDDGQLSCFNTGLVTTDQEPINAIFEPRREGAPQPWLFKGWLRNGHREMTRFSVLPELAHYFDNPRDLILDAQKEIRLNIEHIMNETPRERFPEPYRHLENYALQNFLRGATDRARERVRRSYKTAIPQYYRGQVQLLLPLCLTSPGQADLALVVEGYPKGEPEGPKFYWAATCLTLDMAYNNARQIARPDRDWLQP